MKTLTLNVSSLDSSKQRMAAAFRGERQGEFISFESVELLWKVFTVKRWEIVRAMAGRGDMAIREVARLVERDVKAVHGEIHKLLDAGILDRTEEGRVVFPYDAVHVDFTVTEAA